MVKAPFREARRLSSSTVDVDRMCAIALLLPHNRRFSTRPCALPPDLRVSDIPVGPCICFFVRSAFVLFDLVLPLVRPVYPRGLSTRLGPLSCGSSSPPCRRSASLLSRIRCALSQGLRVDRTVLILAPPPRLSCPQVCKTTL